MTTKEAIHQLVDTLDEETAIAFLDYLRALTEEDRSASSGGARSSVQPRPVESLKVGQPASDDDPVRRIAVMVGGEYDDQHEVDEQMAEAAPALTRDDPLWNIVGIGSTAEPTNVAEQKDEYLADAIDTHRP